MARGEPKAENDGHDVAPSRANDEMTRGAYSAVIRPARYSN